jgi:hypothetical protein
VAPTEFGSCPFAAISELHRSDRTADVVAAAVALAAAMHSVMFNNSCLSTSALQPPTLGAPTTFLSRCPSWVIETTDAVWSPGRSAYQINQSLHEHFYEGWESTSTYGHHSKGMAALETLVYPTAPNKPCARASQC